MCSELVFVIECILSRGICHNLADLIRVTITQLSLPIKTFPALCASFGYSSAKKRDHFGEVLYSKVWGWIKWYWELHAHKYYDVLFLLKKTWKFCLRTNFFNLKKRNFFILTAMNILLSVTFTQVLVYAM